MPERDQFLHKQAVDINNRSKDINGCIPGSGECCTSVAPMTEGDVERLKTAIKSGKVPQAIIDYALTRAKDQSDTRCPFLSRTNKCLIYDLDIKPLVCEIWGLGGRRMNAPFQTQIAKDGTRTAVYHADDIEHYSCEGCSKVTVEGVFYAPKEIVDKADEIKLYVDRNRVTTTRKFVLEHLDQQ